MIGIKEKIAQNKLNGDIITCKNIKIYAQKQRSKQFDGALYTLIKALENMKIEFQLIVLNSNDAFGFQLPILRLENKIVQRQSFFDIIRIFYLHSDDIQAEENNSRVSNFIDLCSKIDQTVQFFEFFDEETEYPFRDSYNWFIQPIKKYAFRWRMRVISHFFESKGLLDKSNVLNDIYEMNGDRTFSQGAYSSKYNLDLDVCDILISGILLQCQFNLSPKCDLVKILDQERYSKIKVFCSSFYKKNIPMCLKMSEEAKIKYEEEGIILTQTGTFIHKGEAPQRSLSLFYESVLHPEVQEQREKQNEKVPSAKKLKKQMINNITINTISLFLFGVILFKFKPQVSQVPSNLA